MFSPLHGQLAPAVAKPLPRRKLALQLLLPDHRADRLVHAQYLMVTREDLAHCTWLAGVEQNEIFYNIQQAVLGEHTVEQNLGLQTALVTVVVRMPFTRAPP